MASSGWTVIHRAVTGVMVVLVLAAWLAMAAAARPGLFVATTLVTAPQASAFVLGLLSTALALLVALALGLRDLLGHRARARRPHPGRRGR